VLAQNWETGAACRSCNGEIHLGAEILYNRHLACAQADALARRQKAGEDEDVTEVARRKLTAKGRIVLTSRQLRELIRLSGVIPVRKPDIGAGRVEWYGRLKGWTPERVDAGLSPAEVAGLWLDHLDIGRQPPIRHADLHEIMKAISTPVAAAAAAPECGTCAAVAAT
jgi:hypothetical protein